MRICSLALSAALFVVPAFPSDVSIVQRFLPTNAHVCSLITADVNSARIIERHPGVIRGSLITEGSPNIVAAYSTEPVDGCTSIKLLVLGWDHNEWKEVASLSFPDEYLWMENGKTTGLQTRKLPGSSRDGLVLITSKGAALGAQIKILQWDKAVNKFVNVAPADAEGVSFEMLDDDSLVVHTRTKQSLKFVFNGKRFTRTQR